ncbi:hypothetical protein DPX39_060047300 [Trypanosoma brucei equiperdum]|uniref:Uncharacterized protein n=2 Tax=Trypanosoma brucei TaxID=5691 RepID=A0A3L6L5V1_9TRYP|nr:hypothetical protein DPX39_060047300 [Trypanosoma brucei equiperdum]
MSSISSAFFIQFSPFPPCWLARCCLFVCVFLSRMAEGSDSALLEGVSFPVEPFAEKHRKILTLLAHAATQAVNTRSNEVVFDVLCSSEPSLARLYPEVAVLQGVHQIRRVLRNLQDSQPHVRPMYLKMIVDSLKDMNEMLPDPLLLVIARTVEILEGEGRGFRELEPHLLDLVEYIQVVILRETKLLQCRGTLITLRLRGVPPFVASETESTT